MPAYDPRDGRGVLRNLVVRDCRPHRAGADAACHLGRLVPAPARRPAHRDRGPCRRHRGPTGVIGEEYLSEELCGLRFRVGPGAFLQTNTEIAERLYALAVESPA